MCRSQRRRAADRRPGGSTMRSPGSRCFLTSVTRSRPFLLLLLLLVLMLAGSSGTNACARRGEPATPLAAVRAYAGALRDGDARRIQAMFHADGAMEQAAAEAVGRYMAASAHLEKA